MDWDKVPVLHAQVASRVVDNSAVIVLADSGEVTILNEVGTRIWELIDGKRSARDIAGVIIAEYDVSETEAAGDVTAFLDELLQANALILADRPVAANQSALD